ncbi:MAG: zf-HC2 domain-containing protein [Candidatus Aminicenantes bacterium]|nr:zf-HC2 domain-containing protein [Candidatus Aminicenantes bacterium]
MKCNAVRRKMHLFYYRELTLNEREQISEHLRHCAQCAGEYSRMESMMLDLTQAVMEPRAVSEDVTWRRIQARLEPPPGARTAHLLRLAAALLIFAIGLGAGLWLNRSQTDPSLTTSPRLIVTRSEWNQYLGDLELLLLDAGNNGLPVSAATAPGEQTLDRLLFQNRCLSRAELNSPEAHRLLEETALLLQEIRNRSDASRQDPEWLPRIIAERRMLERIRLLLSGDMADSRLEAERAPVI